MSIEAIIILCVMVLLLIGTLFMTVYNIRNAVKRSNERIKEWDISVEKQRSIDNDMPTLINKILTPEKIKEYNCRFSSCTDNTISYIAGIITLYSIKCDRITMRVKNVTNMGKIPYN